MAAFKIANFSRTLFPDGAARTERLLLTPLQASDAFSLVVLTNDPLVAAGVSHLRQPFTLGDAQDLIGLASLHKGCFASVRLGENGPFIGCAGGLVRDETDIELGFWIGAPYHGRQLGAEAASAMLGLLRGAFPERRIVVECSRENGASWRLLQKLGFSPEAKSAPKNAPEAKSARKASRVLVFNAGEAAGWIAPGRGPTFEPTIGPALSEAPGAADR
jgi:RimJ/RimL family protein N-acetyltransferase